MNIPLYVITSLLWSFTTFSAQAGNVDQQADIFAKKIEAHAQIAGLHLRQYIHATQQLGKARFEPKMGFSTPDKETLEFDPYTSKRWKERFEHLTSEKEKEVLLWKTDKMLTLKRNEVMYKIANSLNLDIFKLKAFFELSDNPLFKDIISPNIPLPEENHNIPPQVIEMPCLDGTCNSDFIQTDVENVAKVWQSANNANVPNKQLFIVRYVNSQGEQVGLQEYWRHYEKLGPRFYNNYM